MNKGNYTTGCFYRAFLTNQICKQKAYADVVYLGDNKFMETAVFSEDAGLTGKNICQRILDEAAADNVIKIYDLDYFDGILSLSEHMESGYRLSERQMEWLTQVLTKRNEERMLSCFGHNYVFGKVYTLRKIGTGANRTIDELLSGRSASGSPMIESTGIYVGDDKFVVVSMADDYTASGCAAGMNVADDAFKRFFSYQSFHIPPIIIKRREVSIVYETEAELKGVVDSFDCILSTEQMNMVVGLVRIKEGTDELVRKG